MYWGGRRRGFGVLSGLAGLSLVAAGVTVPQEAGADTTEPVRILVVGDSVTQGSAGDWTWRYRLWQHLIASDVVVDFVGPREDLYDNVRNVHGSLAYVDPAFDRDHAGRWGQSLEVQDFRISALVTQFQPDVVVEMLGVNDLTWGGAAPATVADRLEGFVADARSADPSLHLVLAHAPQTWATGVSEFNELVDGVATAWDEPDARAVAASTDDGFLQWWHTWDPAHANANGESLIAAAVADALSTIGVGAPVDRPVAQYPLGPRYAATLSAAPGNGRASLTWSGPPGATGQYVWVRDVTLREAWRRLPYLVHGGKWTDLGLTNGHRYAFRLQPVKGYWASDDVRSNTVRVVPERLPSQARRLRLDPRPRALHARWARAPRATSYRVSWWPIGSRSATRTRTVSGRTTWIGSLSPRKRYAVTVAAVNGTGIGPVSKRAVARPRR